MLNPGSSIGIFGGGQLGRMTAHAAQRLGFHAHIFSSSPDDPACQVTPLCSIGRYDDLAAVRQFVDQVDVVTLEFENIPLPAAKVAENLGKLRPNSQLLDICQDRRKEKQFACDLGFETTRFVEIHSLDQVSRSLKEWGPCILKTARLGYDGKGQLRLESALDAGPWLEKRQKDGLILEQQVDLATELSCIVARNQLGQVRCFPVTENQHETGILRTSRVPANITDEQRHQVEETCRTIAHKTDLVGVLTVEFFLSTSGAILINEMAPRPHNSGHWTLDGCSTDQFEQLVRAVSGLPLGSTEFLPTSMHNLLGEEIHSAADLLDRPATNLHHYGKLEARPGRKMGHYTVVQI